MRKLERDKVPAPTSLDAPSVAVSSEKAAAAVYYGARIPWQKTHVSYKFSQYKGNDVKGALRLLSGGNCAYCESKIFGNGSREVEHYRPKGGVDGALHPGYWWLAHDWNNLLPTCRDCNKSLKQHIVSPSMSLAEVESLMSTTPKHLYGKAMKFSIRGTRAVGHTCLLQLEDPLLINPCEQDPKGELRWNFSTDLPLIEPTVGPNGASIYGKYTIETCALNRAALVLDRVSTLKILKYRRDLIIDRMNKWNGSLEMLEVIVKDVESLTHHADLSQPFSAMAAAYIEEFENHLEQWRKAQGLPPF